jgi:hypothetical protein
MGYESSSAATSAGRFMGSSYTDYKNFLSIVRRWKKDPEIKSFKSKGTSVEAEWKNGDKRWMNYSPHAGEDVTEKI